MPRCPAASWRPISTNYQHGGNTPRLVILHVMQGTLDGSDSWFRNPAAQVSAHFGTGRDGRLYQWVDTRDTAWHAANANGFSIGIENEGNSGDSLTDAQLLRVAEVVAWASLVHGIPLEVCNDPAGRGLAYHGLGGASWGGHPQCPGLPIIRQRAAILAAVTRKPTTPARLEDQMLLNKGKGARTPIALPNGAKSVRFFSNQAAEVNVDTRSAKGTVTLKLGYDAAHNLDVPDGTNAFVAHRMDGGDNDVSAAVST